MYLLTSLFDHRVGRGEMTTVCCSYQQIYINIIHVMSIIQILSHKTQHHAAPRSTTQHHTASRSITQHHAASRSITQHHAASRSITQHFTQHHTTSHNITQHHTTSQHHAASHTILIIALYSTHGQVEGDHYRGCGSECLSVAELSIQL